VVDADVEAAVADDASNTDGGTMHRPQVSLFDGCTIALVDDFEQAQFPNGVWGFAVQKSGGGSAVIDTDDPFDGKKSVRFDVGGTAPVAYLQASLGMRSRIRYSFGAKFEALTARTVNFNSFEFNGESMSLYFAVDASGLRFREQRFDMTGNPSTTHALGSVPPGWNAYAVTVTLSDTASGHVHVDIDSASAFDFDLDFPLRPGAVDLRAGVVFAEDGATTTRVGLDDTVVCSEP